MRKFNYDLFRRKLCGSLNLIYLRGKTVLSSPEESDWGKVIKFG